MKKRNPLISIIVPIYNTEKFIDKCLKSCINQTYENIEVVIVNDGSTDSSKEICEKYCMKDSRIKLINQKNRGVSKARNTGIKNATGKYICFVDADDWVDKDFCKTLLKNILKNKSQLSVCGVIKTKKDLMYKQEKKEVKILSQQESYYNLITNHNFSGYLCNKLYLKELLLKIGLNPLNEDIHYCEDFLLNSLYLKECNKISYTEEKLYYYRIINNSATQNKEFNKKLFTMIDAYKIILEIYNEISKDNYDYVLYEYIKVKLNINYRTKKAGILFPYEIRNAEEKKRIIRSTKITNFQKIYLLISTRWPIMTSYLKHFLTDLKNKVKY